MTTSTLIHRGNTWQGVARFDDNTALHAAPAQTKTEAAAQLTACLTGKTPWREHVRDLDGVRTAVADARDALVTDRIGLLWSTLDQPTVPFQWGAETLAGEVALKTVVQAELHAIVRAVHTLAEAALGVFPALNDGERAAAIRATPLWQECLAEFGELIDGAHGCAVWMGMPELIARDATGAGITTSVHWFPDVDCDHCESAEEVIDHYEAMTAKRVEALAVKWIADPCYREHFRRFTSLAVMRTMEADAALNASPAAAPGDSL